MSTTPKVREWAAYFALPEKLRAAAGRVTNDPDFLVWTAAACFRYEGDGGIDREAGQSGNADRIRELKRLRDHLNAALALLDRPTGYGKSMMEVEHCAVHADPADPWAPFRRDVDALRRLAASAAAAIDLQGTSKKRARIADRALARMLVKAARACELPQIRDTAGDPVVRLMADICCFFKHAKADSAARERARKAIAAAYRAGSPKEKT